MKLKRKLLDLMLLLTSLLAISGAVAAVTFQSGFLTVVSGSMEPTISPGDTLLYRKVKTESIKKNDIVVLPVPKNPALKFSHRVVVAARELDAVVFQTKGDANPNPDKWMIRVTSEKTPRVVTVIPTSFIFNGPIERKWIYYLLLVSAGSLVMLAALRMFIGRTST